jgi:hypothetical protein
MAAFIPVLSTGLPAAFDLGPSIVFLFLYALLIPVAAWRLSSASLRWPLVHQRPVAFSIERVVYFSLRIALSQRPDLRTSKGINLSMEGIVIASWFGLVHGLIDIFIFHATRTSLATAQTREKRRKMLGLLHIYGLVALPFGIAAGAMYGSAMDNPTSARIVTVFRFLAYCSGF